MSKKKIILQAILALSLAAAPVYAAETPSYAMEEIIITAESYLAPFNEDSINVKVISPGKAGTIPELLRQTSGIDIQLRAASGDNQDGTVKLRGFDARRFTVMLNGRQINSAGVMGGQYIDWTTIPLNTVEKIQIIKGGKLAGHGNTLGGVINIITRDKGVNGGELNILSGENGRYDYMFNYSGGRQKWNFNVVANKTGANGFLRNNDYDATQYGLRLNYDAGSKDSVMFGINKTDTRRGYIVANKPSNPGGVTYDPAYPVSDGDMLSPGGGSWAMPKPGSYWDKYNTYYDFTYKHRRENGYWQLSYWKNYEKRHEVNYDTGGKVVLDRSLVSDRSDNFGISGQTGLNGHTYNYGADYKRLRYGYGDYAVRPAGAGDIYPSQKVNLFGAYVDDSWQVDNRWAAYWGLRYDSFAGRKDDSRGTKVRDTDYSSLSPKLNLSFRNNDTTTTYVSVNRLWRAPSMAEFYWWSQNYSEQTIGGKANPSYQTPLKPERGMGYELGVQHKFNDMYTGKLTFYYQNISDYINFQHTFPFFSYNIDKVKVWGAELENSIALNKTSKLFINYTNQHTAKEGVSAVDSVGLKGELDYRPRHKVAVSYLYDAKPWQVRYTANYVSSQLDGYSGTVYKIGGYTVHNLALIRQLDNERLISLYVDNVFDKEYVEQYNYPMPGRVVSISYSQKI